MRHQENSTQFTVKYCTECNYAWEKEVKKTIVHLDFPTYGLQRKICENCTKKAIKKAIDTTMNWSTDLSICCGALRWNDLDICSECLNNTVFNDNTYELNSIEIDNKRDTL